MLGLELVLVLGFDFVFGGIKVKVRVMDNGIGLRIKC